MWTERPKPWIDGIIIAAVMGLVTAAIFSIRDASTGNQLHVPQCQEVVVSVERRGNVLARCPEGTFIDIVDSNVVCRCGTRRQPESFEREPQVEVIPKPTEPIPTPEPTLQPDDKGTWL